MEDVIELRVVCEAKRMFITSLNQYRAELGSNGALR